MTQVLLDTNVVLDALLKRPALKQHQAVFDGIHKGTVAAEIPLPVFLEMEWVLRSTYERPKAEVIEQLDATSSLLDQIDPVRQQIQAALILYRNTEGIGFDDCIIVLIATESDIDDFVTGDKKLARLYQSLKKKRRSR